MLLIHDMMLETMAQPKAEPCSVPGWRMMGPTPCALTMHQMKNVIPAIGTMMALTVNRWRLSILVSVFAWDSCMGRSHFMDWEPYCGKGDEPEEEEAHEITRSDPSRGR